MEQLTLTHVPGHGRCSLELGLRFRGAPEPGEQVTPDAWQQVIVGEQGLVHDAVDDCQPLGGSVCHADGDGAIELDYRRLSQLNEGIVKSNNAFPVRFLRRVCSRMAGGDRGLQRVGAQRLNQGFSMRERSKTPADQELVPACAILVQQEHGLAPAHRCEPECVRPGFP